MAKSKDHAQPKMTREGQQLVQYFNEHMLQLVQQIRAVLIAAKIKPEDFTEAFLDEAAQDDYYIKTRAAEIIRAQKVNAAKAEKPEGVEELSPADKAQADAAIKLAINATFNNNQEK